MGYVILLAGASVADWRGSLWCGSYVIELPGPTRSATLRAPVSRPGSVDAFEAKGLSQVVRSVQPRLSSIN